MRAQELRVLFQECDDIVSFLFFLQAGKCHFGALDVLLGLGQVIPKIIFSPATQSAPCRKGLKSEEQRRECAYQTMFLFLFAAV
jgi:hypothetical protein